MSSPLGVDAAPTTPVDPERLLPPLVPVVVTTGYVAPGIEMVLHAMALLRNERPDLHYVVAGPTHPELVRRDGERFRWCLEALAEDLRCSDRVHFLDCSLDPERHHWLLERCDAVVVPYRSSEHAVRHTVLSAAAAGRPVIVTRPCSSSNRVGGAVTITIDVDDDEACAAAIDHVVDPARLGRMVGPHGIRFQPAAFS
jgi:glycosyltransferase involved in cell wall biosynthesis